MTDDTGAWDDCGEPELADELRDLVLARHHGRPVSLRWAEALVAEAERRERVGEFHDGLLLDLAGEVLDQLRADSSP